MDTEPMFDDAVAIVYHNANAGTVMGTVVQAMKDDGASTEQLDDFRVVAMAGSYEGLLKTARQFVTLVVL